MKVVVRSMRMYVVVLILLMLSFAQPMAALGAGAKTFYFTGTITFASETLLDLRPSAGQKVQGSLTYDPSQPPAYDTGSVAGYSQSSPSGMSVKISGVTFQGNNASLQVVNDAGYGDIVSGFFRPITVAGAEALGFMTINLVDSSQAALASTALPTNLDPTSFNSRTGYVAVGSDSVGFAIDTLSENPPPLPVTIDVKPGGFPNSINPKSTGVIPVAILTTNEFNATSVHASSVRIMTSAKKANPVRSSLADVDRDGDLDMILHFNTQDTAIQCGNTSITLTGATFDGQIIQGSDSIATVDCP